MNLPPSIVPAMMLIIMNFLHVIHFSVAMILMARMKKSCAKAKGGPGCPTAHNNGRQLLDNFLQNDVMSGLRQGDCEG